MENTLDMNKEAIIVLMALMSENSELCMFENDIYDQETLENEGIPARESIMLMWLAAALVADGMTPNDVFDMGTGRYVVRDGEHCPYGNCGPNWFNYPIKLNISVCFDMLDAIKRWLEYKENFNTFKKFYDVAKALGITTEMVELAAENE